MIILLYMFVCDMTNLGRKNKDTYSLNYYTLVPEPPNLEIQRCLRVRVVARNQLHHLKYLRRVQIYRI